MRTPSPAEFVSPAAAPSREMTAARLFERSADALAARILKAASECSIAELRVTTARFAPHVAELLADVQAARRVADEAGWPEVAARMDTVVNKANTLCAMLISSSVAAMREHWTSALSDR